MTEECVTYRFRDEKEFGRAIDIVCDNCPKGFDSMMPLGDNTFLIPKQYGLEELFYAKNITYDQEKVLDGDDISQEELNQFRLGK